MDLDKAIDAHVQWKVKLRAAIRQKDKLDATTIAADNCCELGKWLHGAGRAAHGRLPAHGNLVDKHARFHRAAGAVASKVNAAEYVLADRMLEPGTDYAKASSDVVAAIATLRRDMSAKV